MADATIAEPVRKRNKDTWRGRGWGVWVPAIALSLVFAVLVIPPAIVLVQTSLLNVEAPDAGFTLDNFARLFGLRNLYEATFNSIVFAAGAAIVGLIGGGAMAWIVERTNAPFKPLAYITVIVSMGTPYILYVVAWLYLLGRAGPVFSILQAVFGIHDLPFNVYSMWGMILIEGFLWSPTVFLMVSPVFRNFSVEMEEAARMSGATVLATVWHISAKLALPAMIGVASFVFIRNLEAFDAPVLIGMPGGVNMLTTEVYLNVTKIPSDYGLASAFSIVLIALILILMWGLGRLTRNGDRFASVTGKSYKPQPLDLGRGRWIAGAIVLVYFFFVLVLPMAALAWNSLMPFMRPMGLDGLHLLTFKHYAYVLSDHKNIQLALNTLMISGGAATGAMLLAVLAGWLSARNWPGKAVLDQITAIPIVFPGVVLAVALSQISLRLPFPAYGTLWIVAVAFIVRYLPYGMRYSHTGVLQIHRELEEAAGVFGATQKSILARIVVPLMTPAIVSGWLFIFLMGAKELSIAVLLSGPSTQTIAVSIFNQAANGTTNELAALGILWTAVLTVCASLFYFLTHRRPKSA